MKKGLNIYKRKDSRYEGRYIKCYVNNKPKYGYVYALTYNEAKEKLINMKNNNTGNILQIKSGVTLREMADEWLATTKIKVKQSSYTKYYYTVINHINNKIGCISMSKLQSISITEYLQKLVTVLYKAEIALSFTNIIKYIPTDKFSKFSAELVKKALMSKDEHIENLEIAKISGKIAENASSRFSTIAESEAGVIFDENGIDIYAALRENAIILFILNPLIYPELSPRMGRLILIDSKKAVQYYFGDEQRKFFVFDEINVYASPTLLDLANKSRSAGIMCIFAAQSLSDLDSAGGEYFKEQIIENCNNFLALRQNSAVNAEKWANILGTRKNLDVTYQLTNNGGGFTEDTGYGSARRVHEFLYHPDEIKTFPTGHGIYMCKDNNTHSKIIIHKPF
ncbi:MAG: TraM recognition domain-containing protein [Firmicutes bacterium]|nr:TraM recognition domain-containing protein [Bacillota bacterium]